MIERLSNMYRNDYIRLPSAPVVNSDPAHLRPARNLIKRAWTIDLLIVVMFSISVCMTFFLNKLSIAGLPIRALMLLAATGLIVLTRLSEFREAARRNRLVLYIIVLAAFVGLISSLINNISYADTFRQILETHVQAALFVLVGATVVSLFGASTIFWLLAGCMCFTGLIAFAQAIGLPGSWSPRIFVGALQNDLELTMKKVNLGRPLGLSYSAVLFGSQSCIAFAAYWIWRLRKDGTVILNGVSFGIVVACAAVCILNLAAGNRSPILGVVVFAFIYVWIVSPRLAFTTTLVGIGFAAFIPVVLDLLADAGVRAAETGDSSAQGRATLRAYGVQLFLDRPIGYGMTFTPFDHWHHYWSDFSMRPNAYAIQQHPLHVYYLNVLNKHGVVALAVFLALIPKLLKHWYVSIAFIPYMIHIYFHNEGPLQSEVLIWIALVMIPTVKEIETINTMNEITGPVDVLEIDTDNIDIVV